VTRWSGRLARFRRGRRQPSLDVLADRLDRNYHWVVTVDARQQELAATVASLASSVDAALGRVAMMEHQLAGIAGGVARVEEFQRAELHHDLRAVGRTLAVASEQLASLDAPTVGDGPLVSIVCAVRARPDLVDRTIAQVAAQTYDRWELLLVDDGAPGVGEADVARWRSAHGVTLLRSDHRGVGAARNLALAAAAGEIVAYLDVDNEWHPTYLARVVDALARRTDAGWTVAAQLVERPGAVPAVRDDRRGADALARQNFIDLNALAHRRALLDVVGGFDEERARLGDWDLVLRLMAVAGEPVRLPAVGSIYNDSPEPRRISRSTPLHPHLAVIRDRGRGHPAKGLRVLLAEWHYPQASESYVRSDLIGLQALGAHVEVWSESDVAVPYQPDAPLHRGDLADTIAAVRPDIVLTHWLHIGAQLRPTVRAAGLPMAVRGHGFDHNLAVLRDLLDDPGVMVQLFPHLVGVPHPRQRPLPVAFDQDRFPPSTRKDRRLVVRTGVGLRTKDYETFLTAATRCADHRFVLSLCRGYLVEDQTDEVVARRDELDAPVEILVDAPLDEVVDLVGRAGVYLHTHGRDNTYGMSVSIAEALGTGCYVVAPDLPGMRGYVGGAADLYTDAPGAAALVQQTVHWDDDRWIEQWRRAADHAHLEFGATDVAGAMFDQWREVLGVRPPV
jgi:glycosyltransferase involved in cell wall biosynthesis